MKILTWIDRLNFVTKIFRDIYFFKNIDDRASREKFFSRLYTPEWKKAEEMMKFLVRNRIMLIGRSYMVTRGYE